MVETGEIRKEDQECREQTITSYVSGSVDGSRISKRLYMVVGMKNDGISNFIQQNRSNSDRLVRLDFHTNGLPSFVGHGSIVVSVLVPMIVVVFFSLLRLWRSDVNRILGDRGLDGRGQILPRSFDDLSFRLFVTLRVEPIFPAICSKNLD